MKYTLLSLLAVLFLSIPSHAALDPIVVAEDLRQPEAKGITEALKSDRPQQRARAALALGRIRSPLGINPLLMLLTDKNYGVRREAVFALGQYGWEAQASGGREKEIAYKIKELLENEGSIPVRIVALEALGKIGLLETPKLVIPHLKDESGPVQAEAIMALYRYRLVAKLRKPDVVLEDIPKEAIDQFAVLVDAVEYPVRRNLAYFFARVKDARGATILAKLSLDSDRWIKMFAIMGLTKIADPASLSTFLKATNDRSSEVQIAALAGVVAVKGEGKLDKDLALELNHHVRTAFAQTLATVPEQVPGGPVDPSAILSGGQADELISKLMSDRSPQVQAAALQSFAKRKKALAKAILTQVI
ncbi:MAG: HEAT repeat domain-containing protein [Bdellovibrionia bacterium]